MILTCLLYYIIRIYLLSILLYLLLEYFIKWWKL